MLEQIRIALVTKFNDETNTGFGLDFISIGMTNIDKENENFYAVSNQFNETAVAKNAFVAENVLPQLQGEERQNVSDIKTGIVDFLQRQKDMARAADTIEIWTKNGVYDQFILTRIFGGVHQFNQSVKGLKGILRVKGAAFGDASHFKMPLLPETREPRMTANAQHHALNHAKHQAAMLRWVEHEAHLRIEDTYANDIKRRQAGLPLLPR